MQCSSAHYVHRTGLNRQHKPTGICNAVRLCSQWGTNWTCCYYFEVVRASECQTWTTANRCDILITVQQRIPTGYQWLLRHTDVTSVTKCPPNKLARPRRRNVLDTWLCPCCRRCAPRQRPPSGRERQALQVITEEAGYPQTRRRKQLIPRARLVHRTRAEEPTRRYVSAVCLPAHHHQHPHNLPP